VSPKIVIPVAIVLLGTATLLLLDDPAPVPPPPGVDSHGDPLPPWAVARIGRFVAAPVKPPFVFAPDGQTVTAAIGDGEVGVIEVATGKVLSRVHLFEPEPGTVRVEDGRLIPRIFPDEDDDYVPRTIEAISPDGRHAAVSSPKLLEVFRSGDGGLVRRIPLKEFWSATFTPDGTCVVLGGVDVRRIDLETGVVDWRIPHPQPLAVAFVGEGRIAVNGYRFLLADIGTATEIVGLPEGYWSRHSIATAPDGRSFVRLRRASLRDAETFLVLHDADDGEIRWQTKIGKGGTVAFSPDGTRIAIGGRSFRVYRAADGTLENRFPGDPLPLGGVTFSPDGGRFAATRLGRLLVWDAETLMPIGAAVPPFDPPSSGPGPFAWSEDSTGISVESLDGTAHIFDAASGAVRCEADRDEVWKAWTAEQALTEVPPGANHAIRSPCGGYVAAHYGGPIRVIEVESDKSIFEIKAMSGTSHIPLAVSPGGKLLAWAGQTSVIELWSVARERRIVKLAGHAGKVLGLAFSPDGRRLASRSADGTVLIWDVTAFE
jgi:WD40 repeat protein